MLTFNPLRSPANISRFIDIIATSLHATPLTKYFIVEIDRAPPPYSSPLVDLAHRRKHFAAGIREESESGAELVEAGDWLAIAFWEPPSFKGTPFTNIGPSERLRTEWGTRVAKVRLSTPHYHLQFLARTPAASGAITAVIQPFLDHARAEGVPAWLEAIDPRGVRIYEHYGFRVVAKVTFG